jgi:hypothetical protein
MIEIRAIGDFDTKGYPTLLFGRYVRDCEV